MLLQQQQSPLTRNSNAQYYRNLKDTHRQIVHQTILSAENIWIVLASTASNSIELQIEIQLIDCDCRRCKTVTVVIQELQKHKLNISTQKCLEYGSGYSTNCMMCHCCH